jgi:hypothetical protein
MSLKKYIRQNVYRWHRVTSLVAAVPILLWSLSGFLHPVMNSFKPEVRNQALPADEINSKKIRISLQQALLQNRIDSIHNFRIIKLDSSYYYQIQELNEDTLTYLSCTDGTLLKNGDPLYASFLAQRYLSEPIKKDKEKKLGHGHEMTADVSALVMLFHTTKPYSKTRITGVKLVTSFNKEYKSSNVLLPVYKVSFDRADGIRLFIETSTGRLATAVDNKKAWFNRFFAFAHSWSFLDGMGNTKNVVLGIFSLLCFLTSLLGFYVYNIIKKKKASTAGKSWHRSLGNIFVATTMLYGLSGAWHAFHKLSEPSEQWGLSDSAVFASSTLNFSFADFQKNLKAGEKLNNVSIVKIDGEQYWQLSVSKGKDKKKKYIHTKTFTELPNGDARYACYLACLFSGNAASSIVHTNSIYKFNNRYSMMNKRLPVIEVSFTGSENYYLETSTGSLSAVTDRYDEAERFSFSNLHMHHYCEHWFGNNGKTIQKTILIATTLGLLLLALTGLFIYFIKKGWFRSR